jgi:hypothetical protein
LTRSGNGWVQRGGTPLAEENKEDPNHATRSRADHEETLVLATHKTVRSSGVHGYLVDFIAADSAGSTLKPVCKEKVI